MSQWSSNVDLVRKVFSFMQSVDIFEIARVNKTFAKASKEESAHQPFIIKATIFGPRYFQNGYVQPGGTRVGVLPMKKIVNSISSESLLFICNNTTVIKIIRHRHDAPDLDISLFQRFRFPKLIELASMIIVSVRFYTHKQNSSLPILHQVFTATLSHLPSQTLFLDS